ncbi:uncharacterized protein C8Q71DRAFT_385636 [Rhodofomes roseus]|uniref:KfrA N-terminal DNA-binding domain-containing protein n=1 Tax=Rhodofomes roseus TaxID=34475 RepID=A0ABQ8K034_9APHY|nr:uncharacterized protein C8Q71DRAFT_385636 [Rhodofomes roseus]KAH9829995.1 hypothetical protein C8Q71DRAFT_385636 [Rhodofomes roseus]
MSTEANAASQSQPASKRWSYFHSALQLAIQRAAHKWTYEDFTECFSIWCEEQPENAPRIFTTVSRHMEDSITESCEQLLKRYSVRENLDSLHAVVTEARARKQASYDKTDVWREDLHPSAAVRARTVPLLDKERDRLRAELQSLDAENMRLQDDMRTNVQAREEVDTEAAHLLDLLVEIESKWGQLPMEEIQSWALQTAESVSNTHPV